MPDQPVYTERDVVKALEKLNASTSLLAWVNIVLTAVILALTVVQLWK